MPWGKQAQVKKITYYSSLHHLLMSFRRFVVVNNEAVTSVDNDNDENDDTKDSTGN